ISHHGPTVDGRPARLESPRAWAVVPFDSIAPPKIWSRGAPSGEIVNSQHFLGLCIPGKMPHHVFARGRPDVESGNIVFDQIFKGSSEFLGQLFPGASRHFESMTGINQTAWCPVIDDDASKPTSHGLDNNAGAKLTDGGKCKDVGRAHQ